MQDKYVDYWDYVSRQLSDNQYVVGFDPFNEPNPSWGNTTEALETILPGKFDSQKLAPLYEKINEKFMNVSKENVMFFEPG